MILIPQKYVNIFRASTFDGDLILDNAQRNLAPYLRFRNILTSLRDDIEYYSTTILTGGKPDQVRMLKSRVKMLITVYHRFLRQELGIEEERPYNNQLQAVGPFGRSRPVHKTSAQELQSRLNIGGRNVHFIKLVPSIINAFAAIVRLTDAQMDIWFGVLIQHFQFTWLEYFDFLELLPGKFQRKAGRAKLGKHLMWLEDEEDQPNPIDPHKVMFLCWNPHIHRF